MIEPDKVEERDELIPESAKEILVPALKFGAFTGPIGLFVGGIGGVLRSSTPILFALVSGLQWFTLGSTFYATRGAILRYHYLQTPTPEDSLRASTVAGGISGAGIGGLLRGRKNFLPALVVFSLFGWAGQSLFNELDARNTRKIQSSIPSLKTTSASASAAQPTNPHPAAKSTPSFLQKVAGKKYSPMKILSDAEYETMLRERLLHVDAEIALLDEKIEMVKQDVEKGRAADDGSGEKDQKEKQQ